MEPLNESLWQRPTPGKGDQYSGVVYSSVGEALSVWEAMELNLALLYSSFKGRFGDLEIILEYRSNGKIFEERIQGIERAATTYFISHHSQQTEGDYAKIVVAARMLARLRNEIAHGTVFGQANDLLAPNQSIRWHLVPSVHQFLPNNDQRRYSYNSANVHQVKESFLVLSRAIFALIGIIRSR